MASERCATTAGSVSDRGLSLTGYDLLFCTLPIGVFLSLVSLV